jgi:hypothetical protein
MIRCAPGCRWLATAVSFGYDSHGDFYSPRCGPSAVARLPLVPVGCVPRPDGHLAHQDGGLDAEHVVGWIEHASLTADGVDVIVHLVDEAVWIRRVLLRLERARVRWGLGLSVDAHSDSVERRPTGRVIRSIDRVDSIDFVTIPAGRTCYVRRRLPCAGVVIRDGLPVSASGTTG